MNEKPMVMIPIRHLAGLTLTGLIMWYGIFRFVKWISPW